MTKEEWHILNMAGEKKFSNRGITDLRAKVMYDIGIGSTTSLRKAAARIIWELNRRADDEEE